jgi:hypothetical protein
MAARSCRSRRGLFIHRRFPYALIAPRSSICSDGIDLLFCSRIKRITPKVGGRKKVASISVFRGPLPLNQRFIQALGFADT